MGGSIHRERTKDTASRIEALHGELQEGIRELVSGDDWQRTLDAAARFHRYSFGNMMLILRQRPEATRCAGYKTWQALGRQVRRGERGIAIFAPRTRKVEDESTGEDRVVLTGFGLVHVFDQGQTEGPDLPGEPTKLTGQAPPGIWDALAREVGAAGYELIREPCAGNGMTIPSVRRVVVRPDLSDAQAVKTLAHELAHVMLHAGECVGSNPRTETEAESTSYIVTKALGMDPDGYSFPYIAGWSGGDPKLVAETGERVMRCAQSILGAIGTGE
jgi:DNA primase